MARWTRFAHFDVLCALFTHFLRTFCALFTHCLCTLRTLPSLITLRSLIWRALYAPLNARFTHFACCIEYTRIFYALFTHFLRTFYALFMHFLRTFYALFTHFAHALYPVYLLYAVWFGALYAPLNALFTHFLRTFYALCVLHRIDAYFTHFLRTFCALFTRFFTHFLLFTQFLRTFYAVFTHFLRTFYARALYPVYLHFTHVLRTFFCAFYVLCALYPVYSLVVHSHFDTARTVRIFYALFTHFLRTSMSSNMFVTSTSVLEMWWWCPNLLQSDSKCMTRGAISAHVNHLLSKQRFQSWYCFNLFRIAPKSWCSFCVQLRFDWINVEVLDQRVNARNEDMSSIAPSEAFSIPASKACLRNIETDLRLNQNWSMQVDLWSWDRTSNKWNKCSPSFQYPLQTLLQPQSKQKRRNQSHRMSCGSFRWSTRATASMLSTKHFLSPVMQRSTQSYYNHKVSVPKMLCWGSEAKDEWSSQDKLKWPL